ncbi:MAG: ferrous iron transporter B, partial [Firmicutes bacterium]|nr:ferrous iron transporter B [Bacillota bacterium]
EDPHVRDRRLDRLFTSPVTGYPFMFLLLCFIFWLTLSGANLPSQWLSRGFDALTPHLRIVLRALSLSRNAESLLVDGLYRTLTWVVSVMLPPMAIFFPLFTLLEDSGYLPRIAFNLDHCFRRCGAHGKQALTTCMAFGCNACAVTGCRIIESPRERMIAILTNALIPCNGKFATLIAILTIFFTGASGSSLLAAALLTLLILLCFGLTLLLSALLSKTLLKGLPSAFSLELPPYRRPQIGKVILRSVLDRTLFVLGRAVCVATPAGVLIWVLANAGILPALTSALDPLGRLMGLDGVILAAFLLGFPANEIVIPILLMTYLSTGVLTDYTSLDQLHQLLSSHGWTNVTALCFLLFSVAHFPCGTTCLTIYRETKSRKWTAAAVLIPTAVGTILCIAVNSLFRLWNLIL